MTEQTEPCDGGCNYDSGPEETCSRHGRPVAEVWAIVDTLITRVAEKDATIQRVRDLHQPVPYGSPETRAVAPWVPESVCSVCLEEYGGCVDYPCPTLAALDGQEGR